MSMNIDHSTTLQLLERMFEIEVGFLKSETKDIQALARAFHHDVVVHEPESLPYSGDWRGLEGVGALLCKVSEVWSDMEVDGLVAARTGETVFLRCTLKLTSRATGAVIIQPFAQVLYFQDGLLRDGTPFYFDTAEIAAAV